MKFLRMINRNEIYAPSMEYAYFILPIYLGIIILTN